MSKYNLVVRNIDNDRITFIPIDKNSFKVNISKIDKFTSKFKDEEELLIELQNRELIDFDNADIFISYKIKGEYRVLDPIYNDLKEVPELIDNKSETKIDYEENIEIFDKTIIDLQNKELRTSLLNSRKLNMKLNEYIEDRFNSTTINEINFYNKKIFNELSSYRNYRNLKMFNKEYNDLDYKNSVLSKENKRIESLKYFDFVKNMLVESIRENEKDYTNEYYEALIWYKEGKDYREMMDIEDINKMTNEEISDLNNKYSNLYKKETLISIKENLENVKEEINENKDDIKINNTKDDLSLLDLKNEVFDQISFDIDDDNNLRL